MSAYPPIFDIFIIVVIIAIIPSEYNCDNDEVFPEKLAKLNVTLQTLDTIKIVIDNSGKIGYNNPCCHAGQRFGA